MRGLLLALVLSLVLVASAAAQDSCPAGENLLCPGGAPGSSRPCSRPALMAFPFAEQTSGKRPGAAACAYLRLGGWACALRRGSSTRSVRLC